MPSGGFFFSPEIHDVVVAFHCERVKWILCWIFLPWLSEALMFVWCVYAKLDLMAHRLMVLDYDIAVC